MTTSPPDHPHRSLLIVSATDSSGVAGMAVDIRVAESCGLACRLAVTAVTVQGKEGVEAVHPVPASILSAAIATAFCDPPGAGAAGVGAVKVGMLATAEVARAVAEGLSPLSAAGVPIVVDPVLAATSGGALLDTPGIEILLRRLLPFASLLTPNRAELARLAVALGGKPGKAGEGEASEEILAGLLLLRGARAVLVKGGEGEGPVAVDTLYRPDAPPTRFEHPRHPGATPRGTGCALSTAIAAFLARGEGPEPAVRAGIALVQRLIAASRMVGGDRLLFPSHPPLQR